MINVKVNNKSLEFYSEQEVGVNMYQLKIKNYLIEIQEKENKSKAFSYVYLRVFSNYGNSKCKATVLLSIKFSEVLTNFSALYSGILDLISEIEAKKGRKSIDLS